MKIKINHFKAQLKLKKWFFSLKVTLEVKDKQRIIR